MPNQTNSRLQIGARKMLFAALVVVVIGLVFILYLAKTYPKDTHHYCITHATETTAMQATRGDWVEFKKNGTD